MKYLATISFFIAIATAAPLSVGAKIVLGTPGIKVDKSDGDNIGNSGENLFDLSQFKEDNSICTGTYKAPVCCTTSVQGVANLDCVRPDGDLTDLSTFEGICRADSRRAMCCGIPIAGQALLCVEASANTQA